MITEKVDFLLVLTSPDFFKSKRMQKNYLVPKHCRDIYFAKYYGRGGGGNDWLGKKMKMKSNGKKIKKGKKNGGKLHEKRGKRP